MSGKDGMLYTINLTDPGETTAADLAPATAPANYAKLAAQPILYTYFDPDDQPGHAESRDAQSYCPAT